MAATCSQRSSATPTTPSSTGSAVVLNDDRFVLFELYGTRWNDAAGRWEAGSGAIFDLSRNDRRPDGWTSADAAGLAILPGLVRYEEANSGRDIGHAYRVTLRQTNGNV